MTDVAANAPEDAPKRSKLPLILAVVLALLGAGGGYFAVQAGLLGSSESEEMTSDVPPVDPVDDIAYVPIEPMIVSLGSDQTVRHLRFNAQLEVHAGYEDDVALLRPRIIDMLNGYLRAIDVADLDEGFALARLRAQILRRVQVIVGEARVRDVLITEFVLN